ncbi:MAG: response regulator transcription factor [Syntrophobacteraceae bacterium]|nr:response regulator transcription factor [Desulfobacteraceae bacterium]
MGRTRILIVDDHQVVIGGIKSTLSDYPELEVIGEALNGREAVRRVKAQRPDIVIMDISMPDLNGIDATLQIKKSHPKARIIIFTMYSDREYVVDLLKAGISGYVLKEDPMSDLILAIQAVKGGGTYFSSMVPGVLVNHLRKADSPEEANDGFKDLSLRERELLQLLAEGNNVKDISAKLDLSHKTVESHKYNMMEKLGVRTLADLTKIAIKKKLIQP